jgi:hypothetical protein
MRWPIGLSRCRPRLSVFCAKAGSVRHAADLGVTAFTAPRPRRTHCPTSWAVARHARKFNVPQGERDGASPIRRAASHAA